MITLVDKFEFSANNSAVWQEYRWRQRITLLVKLTNWGTHRVVEKKAAANPQLIRRINRETVLYHLRQHGQLSRSALAELTHLSKPSISTLADELIGEGCIREIGIGVSSGGRRPILLEINSSRFSVVGLVFEGTRLAVAAFDLNGVLLAENKVLVEQRKIGASPVPVMQQALEGLLRMANIDRSTLLGIGVGLPGITRRSGFVSFSPSTGWRDHPIKQELEEIFGLPVVVENDVNLMALGELRQGAGIGIENLVYIHVGTGIGSGIIINGSLYSGASDAAGEIGSLVIGDSVRRKQPESGLFESNYSSTGLEDKLAECLGEEWRQAALQSGGVLKLLAERQAVPQLAALLDNACQCYTYGIANIVCVLNPELVILGGDLVQLGDQRLGQIRTELSQLVPVLPQVKFAVLGDNAGVIGAAQQVMENDRSLTGKLR